MGMDVSEGTLLESRGNRRISRDARVADAPDALAAATHPMAWRILVELAKSPDYPSALAKRLRVHEQKVYYHINRLRRGGLLRVVREEQGQGAPAKVLAPSAEAFALVLPGSGRAFSEVAPLTGSLQAFLGEFGEDGALDAWIVLGAPTPHGPFLTAARDSPYGAHLGLFLGRYFGLRRGLAVKLDTEVKAEGLEKGNLILIGGPVANIISLDLNPHLAVTDHTDSLLRGYGGGEMYRVVQGLDRDGDGRLDDVNVLEGA